MCQSDSAVHSQYLTTRVQGDGQMANGWAKGSYSSGNTPSIHGNRAIYTNSSEDRCVCVFR